MQTHYEHYLLGCREAAVTPLSFWRFRLAYGRYQREVRDKLGQNWDDPAPKERHRLVIESRWLIGIDTLVRQGERIAELAAQHRDEGDEPGAAGAGTREPRTPVAPVLVGCASRTMPAPEVMKEQYDWRV